MFAVAFLAAIVFVPLDDRPVTRQLPQMLGQIAGVQVIEPPKELLGNYLVPGQPDAIAVWLNHTAQQRAADSYVLSSDMLIYGGLVASRTPYTGYSAASSRSHEFIQLRRLQPQASIDVFGTIMRLAPTGIPAIGKAQYFFAAFPIWSYLQEYANLHDPLLPAEQVRAEQLRTLIGEPVLDAYVLARLRDYGIDRELIRQAATNTIGTLVLGQDDAGTIGLHVKEVNALQEIASIHTHIEPGADELGMVLVARALAQNARWVPHIAVRYYGSVQQDPREFATIPQTIDSLISVSGGIHDNTHPDIVLDVRLPDANGTTRKTDDMRLLEALGDDERNGTSIGLADLTFLENTYDDQRLFAQQLLQTGLASRLDAYAAWNTDANTVGTVLAEAIAAGAGRRAHTYNTLAHRQFTFMRFLDDYAFHTIVRPQLNTALDAQGITDHTYLLDDIAVSTEDRNRSLLWQQAPSILQSLYAGLHIAAMQISLPWQRTFETEIDVGLAPNLRIGSIPAWVGEHPSR